MGEKCMKNVLVDIWSEYVADSYKYILVADEE